MNFGLKIRSYFIACLIITISAPSQAAAFSFFKKTAQPLEMLGEAQLKKLPSDQIDVLVWNVHKGDDERWYPEFEELIKEREIVMVQEGLYTQEMRHTFASKKEFIWDLATSFHIFYKQSAGTGVATGSIARALETSVLTTVATEPVVSTHKVSLYSEFALQGRTDHLLVVNVHAINFVSDLSYMMELLRIKNKIKAHQGPLLLAGDFNTWSNMRMKALKRLAKTLHLTTIEFADSARSTGLGHFLDHAFIRGMEAVKVENLGNVQTSDHKPLGFTLRAI